VPAFILFGLPYLDCLFGLRRLFRMISLTHELAALFIVELLN